MNLVDFLHRRAPRSGSTEGHTLDDHLDLWDREVRHYMGERHHRILLDDLARTPFPFPALPPPPATQKKGGWRAQREAKAADQSSPQTRIWRSPEGRVLTCVLCGAAETLDGVHCPRHL